MCLILRSKSRYSSDRVYDVSGESDTLCPRRYAMSLRYCVTSGPSYRSKSSCTSLYAWSSSLYASLDNSQT